MKKFILTVLCTIISILLLFILVCVYSPNNATDNKIYEWPYNVSQEDTLDSIIDKYYDGTKIMEDIGHDGIVQYIMSLNKIKSADDIHSIKDHLILPYYNEDYNHFNEIYEEE